MKRLQWTIVVLLGCYVLYLIKSELGINISQRYHAIDLIKLPLRVIHQAFDS